MTAYYDITTKLYTNLLADPLINKVTKGDIYDVQLDKREIYALAHLMVNSASCQGKILVLNMSLITMDLVNINKVSPTDKYIGNDNEDDVLNAMLAVQVRLFELLRRGDLQADGFELSGQPSLESFTDRFADGVAGWGSDFSVQLFPNMKIC